MPCGAPRVCSHAGGSAQTKGRGLRRKVQVPRGIRDHPVEKLEIIRPKRLTREGQRDDREGQDNSLGEKGYHAPVVVLGILGVARRACVLVQAAHGNRSVSVKQFVELRARCKNRKGQDKHDR